MEELSALDASRLAQALALAQGAIALSEPNPRVGCVLGSADGQQLYGQGHTQRAGQAHAEVAALADAIAQGHQGALRGATAWVSLEPCAHHGRTPPCCDALIAAGIARVVVAAADPFPAVNGQGVARLRAAGVQVDVLAPRHPLAVQAREINIGFFSRQERQRPWVRMKVAASLDGRTALHNGTSQWITSAQAREDGHIWRRRAGALLTGIGTVLEDQPRLTVRLDPQRWPVARAPVRVIVDSRLQTPLDAPILELGSPGAGPIWIYHASLGALEASAPRARALVDKGVQLHHLPAAHGKVDLHALMADLAQRGINEVHVEAGHKLNASLLQAGLVDELLIYLAPTLLGVGREMAAFGPIEHLAQGLAFEFHSVDRVGPDLRVLARRAAP